MARRRFFVDGVHHRQAELTGEDAHHLVRVLRVEAGQTYEVADRRGSGIWLATVDEARKSRVVFTLGEPVAPKVLPVRLTLLAALIKFDRLEWIFEKGTELGVERFVPVIAERSEKGLDKAAIKRNERWERIVLEASQQSRRDRLPEIAPAVRLHDALQEAGHITATRLFLDEAPQGASPILSALPDVRTPEDRVALLLGPEGGWTTEERDLAIAAEWRPVTLGPQVLRAETAATAAAAIVMSAWQAPHSSIHLSYRPD